MSVDTASAVARRSDERGREPLSASGDPVPAGARRWPSALVAALALVALAFNAGGFFAGTAAVAAVLAVVALVALITLTERPLGSAGLGLLGLAGALVLLGGWILLSSTWSDAAARALLEFDRALLYLLVALVAGLAAGGVDRRRGLLYGIALGAGVVCSAGLATILLPEVVGWGPEAADTRLAYPITYWNALGLLAVIGVLACAHLTAWEREPAAVRVVSAGAIPILAATLYFTFSRGAMIFLPLGLVLYLAVARPRGAPGAALAVLPATAVALWVAYGAEALNRKAPSGPEAVGDGRHLALVLLACVAVAAVVRVVTLPVDRRLARVRVSRSGRRSALTGVAVLAVAAGGIAVAAGVPGWASRQVDRFVGGDYVEPKADQRSRLVDAGNNGRLDQWRVAVEGWAEAPWKGHGAGTYENLWARDRPTSLGVVDGHSLYTEALAELGVVGFLLIAFVVASLVGGCARRARGPDRAVGAAALAIVVVWAGHAGIDWDWEVPVVTLPAIALGAASLASTRRRLAPSVVAPPRLARILLALGCLLVAITPARIALSQIALDDAAAAYRRGDCRTAVDRSLASARAVGTRPEAFVLLSVCDVRLGEVGLAVQAAEAAVARDPGYWRWRYLLALARGSAGLDPRPAVRAALEANPRSELVRDAVERFGPDDPAVWRREAARSTLPF